MPITAGRSVCLGCGCLCDDIEVIVDEDGILDPRHACDPGRIWFSHEGQPTLEATIDGSTSTADAALDRAAEILVSAQAPLITGLCGLTIEAQRFAVALADTLGGVIDSSKSWDLARQQAFARVGIVTASLGEVKARADVVVFFGVDPMVTHPRHMERYSAVPEGRFLTRARTVIVARSNSKTPADVTHRVDPCSQLAVLATLRAILRNAWLDRARVETATGLSFEAIQGWASTMMTASYGACFFGSDLPAASIESLLLLVRELNERTRFVAIGLGQAGNLAGAESVLTWQAGYPSAIDFSSGVPHSLVGDTSVDARLARSEGDVLLILGQSDQHFGTNIPTLAIGFQATRRLGLAVGIEGARPGIEARGSVARVDGVMLPLRAIQESSYRTEESLLRDLLGRVVELQARRR